MEKTSYETVETHEGDGAVYKNDELLMPGVRYSIRGDQKVIHYYAGGKTHHKRGKIERRGRIDFFFGVPPFHPLTDDRYTLQLQDGSLVDFVFRDSDGNITCSGGIRKGPAI